MSAMFYVLYSLRSNRDGLVATLRDKITLARKHTRATRTDLENAMILMFTSGAGDDRGPENSEGALHQVPSRDGRGTAQ
jgi:hypothetical protein